MGVAVYIVQEKEIDGFDAIGMICGKAMGRAKPEKLAELSQQLGVKDPYALVSADPDEFAEFGGPDFDEEWFEPSDGLEMVQAYMKHLKEHPGAIEDSEAIMEDLKDYLKALERLNQEQVRWHFAIDY